MENTNSKILTMSYGIAGAIAGLTVHLLVKAFAGAFGIVARMTDTDLVRHGLPLGIGFLVFALMQFNPKVNKWAEEVVVEVRKTSYPNRKEVTGMTIVCIVMVLISSVIIGTFDMMSGFFINFLMK